jgi:hypothetical protein
MSKKRTSSSNWNYKGKKTWDFVAPKLKQVDTGKSKIVDINGVEIDLKQLDLESIELKDIETDITSPTVGEKEKLDYVDELNRESQFKRQTKAKALVDRGLNFVQLDSNNQEKYQFASPRAYEGYWKVEKDENNISESLIFEVTSRYTYKNKFYKSLDFTKYDPYKKIKIRVIAKRYYDYPEKVLVGGGWYLPPTPYIPPDVNIYNPRIGTKTSSWVGRKMMIKQGTILDPGGSISYHWLGGDPLILNNNLTPDFPFFPYGNTFYPEFDIYRGAGLEIPVGTISSTEIRTNSWRWRIIEGTNKYSTVSIYMYGTKNFYSHLEKNMFFLTGVGLQLDSIPSPLLREYVLGEVEISPIEQNLQSIIFLFENKTIFDYRPKPLYFEAETKVENNEPVIVVKIIGDDAVYLMTNEDDPGFKTLAEHLF